MRASRTGLEMSRARPARVLGGLCFSRETRGNTEISLETMTEPGLRQDTEEGARVRHHTSGLSGRGTQSLHSFCVAGTVLGSSPTWGPTVLPDVFLASSAGLLSQPLTLVPDREEQLTHLGGVSLWLIVLDRTSHVY